jgi:hypothetical protein
MISYRIVISLPRQCIIENNLYLPTVTVDPFRPWRVERGTLDLLLSLVIFLGVAKPACESMYMWNKVVFWNHLWWNPLDRHACMGLVVVVLVGDVNVRNKLLLS